MVVEMYRYNVLLYRILIQEPEIKIYAGIGDMMYLRFALLP